MNTGGSAGAAGVMLPSPAPSTVGVIRSLPSSSSTYASVTALSSSFQQAAEDSLLIAIAEDLAFSEDAKLETQQALMEELLESLSKEEKLLDNDAWKYAAPRSQLHLTSMTGVRFETEVPSVYGNRTKGERVLR
ncbi:hypothetical protein KP509_39G025300 [Ceratopteris richardii]|uniref:Uncharacterized protein n=1 Tax=Ceratopteris richardii TaxID=49495 RepID=A0A8T2PZN2_CERRI|nr:hypothetical protein KP509_39G025300 [Ceratopteris richardii]